MDDWQKWQSVLARPWFNGGRGPCPKPGDEDSDWNWECYWAEKELNDEKERSYWAGPWEQKYSKTYLHDASLFQVGKDQWRVCCFWHEGYGYGGDFGPAEG